jgi:uncharacterized membrane protein
MSSDNGRTMVIVAYVLHLLGACTGLLSIIALIINYAAKGSHGDLIDSHHDWMIRTFWYTFLGFVIAWVLAFTFIGIPLAGLLAFTAWLWYIYRHVKGLIFLLDSKAVSATAWV